VSDIDTGVVVSLKVLDPDGRLEKRTNRRRLDLSALCQKRTHAVQQTTRIGELIRSPRQACEQHGRPFGGQAAQRSSRCHERLDYSIAAINHDDRAGYIGREVGGKEDRWPNNILRLSGSTERCVIDKDLH